MRQAGAQRSGAIENFEDNTGVISQPANNREIDLHELGESALIEVGDDLLEFLAPPAAVENFENRPGEGAERCGRFLARLTFALVDDLQEFAPALVRHVLFAEKVGPEFAVTEPDDEILRAKAKPAQEIDRERDYFDIRA